jgi:hypothetical protein
VDALVELQNLTIDAGRFATVDRAHIDRVVDALEPVANRNISPAKSSSAPVTHFRVAGLSVLYWKIA